VCKSRDVIERDAWVRDRRERERAASELEQLVGRRLRRVRYFEIDYDDKQPAWPGPGFDALDFGLELDVDGPDATWSWIWKQSGENEGLLVYDAPLRGDQLRADGEYAIWDASESPGWEPVLGRQIAAAEIAWTRGGPGWWCVASTTLRFDQGTEIVITLGARGSDGRFVASADDVVVFFSRASADRHAECWRAASSGPHRGST
jgi:hypothetical protein